MEEKKLHISSGTLYLVLLCLIGQSTLYLYDYPILHTGLSMLRLLCFLYVVFACGKRFKLDIATATISTYCAVLLYTTMKGGGNLFSVITFFINSITLTMIILDSVEESEESFERTIHTLGKVFSLLVYINLLTLLIDDNGILKNNKYILGGNYNQMGLTMLIGILTNAIYYKQWGKGKLNLICTTIAAILSPLLVGSMTSTVGLLILTGFLLIPSKILRRWAIYSLSTVYLIFQGAAVFAMGDLSNVKYVVFFVEDVLHKDMTFTLRAGVWLRSLDMIQESPTLGYGTHDMSWYLDNLGGVTTAHNIFLQTMLDGGYILVAVLLISVLSTIAILAYNNRQLSTLFIFAIVTTFFMMMMETYPVILILLILTIAYYYVVYTKKYDKL